ncbi:MAG: HAD-IA family hydrolase [Cellulomonas sp.]
MPSPRVPRAIVFDVGGVLVPTESSLGDLARELRIDRADLVGAYWRPRSEFDRGGASSTYWQHVTTELGCPVGPGWIERLDSIDAAPWGRIAGEVAQLLAELTRGAIPLSLLSNAPVTYASAVRAARWSSAFTHLVFSADVGAIKPETEIYEIAEGLVGARGPDVLFFDDSQANVDAAGGYGWRAHLWTGLSDARQVLVAAGALGS